MYNNDKSIHYRWLAGHITKAGENYPCLNADTIYKNSLKFDAKAYWSIVRHCISPPSNHNILGKTNSCLVVALILRVDLNIPWIIIDEIQDRVLQLSTVLSFPCLMYLLMRNEQVLIIVVVDQLILPTNVANMILVKYMRNLFYPEKVLEIPNVVGGPLVNDLLAFDIGASSSSAPPTSIHNRPLFFIGFTLIPNSQLGKFYGAYYYMILG